MLQTINAELRNKINQIIRLSNDDENAFREKYPNGRTITIGAGEDSTFMEDYLNRESSLLIRLLETLSTSDLIFVTALVWWGRGDGVAEQGETFTSVLNYASSQSESGRIGYLSSKSPLGRYLEKGLARG